MRPQKGDLRVWCIVNLPSFAIHVPVDSPEKAAAVIDYMADDQLTEPRITSNVFGLEVYDFGSWIDWESELGEDLDDYMESKEVQE